MRPTLMERAYELAKSGECDSVRAITVRLNDEGYLYPDSHLSGPTIRSELLRLCRESWSRVHGEVPPKRK